MASSLKDSIDNKLSQSWNSDSAVNKKSRSLFTRKQKYLSEKKYFSSEEQVVKNIETVINFQMEQELNIPIHERIVRHVAAFFGTSKFLYFQLFFFLSWWLCSHFATDLLPLNLPKFELQDLGVDVASLLIATGVLVQQTRQDKLSEQRSHLMLQVNLLTEQKIAKLIGLMEELRSDLPSVKNRYDLEAEVMKRATDPQTILDILHKNLEQTEQVKEKEAQNPEPEPSLTSLTEKE